VLADAPDFSAVPSAAPRAPGAGAGAAPPPRRSGFKWRGGHERMTTGIWLWSRPFVRRLPGGGDDDVAVLLMDTQGLFDSETGQMLTTAIFGLSTLISSVQVYNVTRQIQEDQLQHLALFTEYGRRVLEQQQAKAAAAPAAAPAARRRAPAAAAPPAGGAPAAAAADEGAGASGGGGHDGDGVNGDGDGDAADGGVGATDAVRALRRLGAPAPRAPPFQRLDFLIRDAVIRSLKNPAAVERECDELLAAVLAKEHNKDLKAVREHLRGCFEALSAFALPHPGYEVAENEQYAGAIRGIRDEFRVLVAQ
jgi:atlastin